MSLTDKLISARQFTELVDGHTYTLRRPTDEEAIGLTSISSSVGLVKRFVIGWDHTEISLGIPGGNPTPAPFSAELWSEWVADQPQVWPVLATAIVEAYQRHVAAREQTAKN
jgi:hypothetical protein